MQAAVLQESISPATGAARQRHGRNRSKRLRFNFWGEDTRHHWRKFDNAKRKTMRTHRDGLSK